MRSAGLHYCSNAISFVPDIGNIISFEKHVGTGDPTTDDTTTDAATSPDDGVVESKSEEDSPSAATVKGAGLSAKTIASAKTLDRVITEMSKNFAEGTDYFKILVKVFQEVNI